ncbi:MAG: UDP-N-acetylmuramate--L-alanine ligase [Gammaproteobacteria bacterium]|nr:UDP-N-acetylmuramate--L-alanine ligase [Gammaproteobacteria bacterium]MYF39082.1 UDP-N-acetylmuramate--L-alanine ligase [Gammaproteobacteria bacterium]
MKAIPEHRVEGMPLMRRVRNVHFVGIGGAGMCGIAEVMHNQGYQITGSDLTANQATERLQSLGVTVHVGHDAKFVSDVDALVVSTAIPANNSELQAARNARIPVVSRAEMLGELLRARYGIAVAGSHGKTTTTSLIVSIFNEAGWDPTYVIGGLLRSEGRHAKLGGSRYLIAEADESDASFLYLNPMVAVICNIDRDHLSTYDHDYNQLLRSFEEFVHRLPFYGLTVVCSDDYGVQQILDKLARPVVTYGLKEGADYRASNIRYQGTRCKFTINRPDGQTPLEVETCLPGDENVRNALGAVAIASDEGVPDQDIVDGLQNYEGIHRRFDTASLTVNGHNFMLLDDYGHHPTELAHMVSTSRELFPKRRIFMVFQPHRFTRTRDLFHDFVEGLGRVDNLVVVDTYAASETPIVGAYASDLTAAIEHKGTVPTQFAPTTQVALEYVLENIQDDDVLIVQGAGNVDQVSTQLKSLAQ